MTKQSKKPKGPSKELIELKEIILEQFEGREDLASYWFYIPNRLIGNHLPITLVQEKESKYVLQ